MIVSKKGRKVLTWKDQTYWATSERLTCSRITAFVNKDGRVGLTWWRGEEEDPIGMHVHQIILEDEEAEQIKSVLIYGLGSKEPYRIKPLFNKARKPDEQR